jgi:3-oxoadipate enol-lactonase
MAELGSDLVALLDAIGTSRAHLCGLSLGGMVSLWVALHHPTRVDRLVVCGTSAHLGRSKAWRRRSALVRALGTAAIADSVVERWLTPSYRAAHPELSSELAAIVAATPIDGYAGGCAAIAGMDLGPCLSAIRVPTLAIAATEDPETPPEHLAGIAAAIPRCRMALISRAAHLANLEQPETVTDLVLRHLEG